MRAVQTPEDAFLSVAEEMPDGYLECRGSQHRFVLIEPFRIVDSEREDGARPHQGHVKYARRVLECDRCIDPETGHGMIRYDFYSISSLRGHTFLEKINARYIAPAGYSVKGIGRVENNRGLILGAQLDRSLQGTVVRGRGRPSKKAT